jgi:hypothetical protein
MTSEESSRELTKRNSGSYNDDSGQDDSLKENFNNPANKSEKSNTCFRNFEDLTRKWLKKEN